MSFPTLILSERRKRTVYRQTGQQTSAWNQTNFTGRNPWTGEQLNEVNTRAEYDNAARSDAKSASCSDEPSAAQQQVYEGAHWN